MRNLQHIIDTLKKSNASIAAISMKLGFKNPRLLDTGDDNLHFLVEEIKPNADGALEREFDFRILMEDVFDCQIRVDVLGSIREEYHSKYIDSSINIDAANDELEEYFDPDCHFHSLDSDAVPEGEGISLDNRKEYLLQAKQRLQDKGAKSSQTPFIREEKLLKISSCSDRIFNSLPGKWSNKKDYSSPYYMGAAAGNEILIQINNILLTVRYLDDEAKGHREHSLIGFSQDITSKINAFLSAVFRKSPSRWSSQGSKSASYNLSVKKGEEIVGILLKVKECCCGLIFLSIINNTLN